MPHPIAHPPLPSAIRQTRGWLWRSMGHAYLRLAGWRIEGPFPTDPKLVVIVAPHTSNWDFTLGMALMLALELRVSWFGKHTIFKRPFRRLLRWLGGIPVDRRASHGLVGEYARIFDAAEALLLALSPEGTRKGAGRWRSGFYQIAQAAGVPIQPVAFDYREHVVHLLPLFHPRGNPAEDLPRIQALFSHAHGLRNRPVDTVCS